MKSRFFITVFALLLAVPMAFSLQCPINFDISCPLTIPQCSSDFIGGINCVVEGPSSCKDSGVRTFKIDQNNSLYINYSLPIYAVEMFLTGLEGSQANAAFLDEGGNEISALSTNNDCDIAKPARHKHKFSQGVFAINITANGTVYLDTLLTNPNSLCSASDTACDGIDDDCDGLVDENANSTCDNGLYCDGMEFCLNGACQLGSSIDCSANNIVSINSCLNSPDNNPFTFDNRSSFTSSCNENIDSCAVGSQIIVHECSLVCGAGCTSNANCLSGFMCDASCSCVKDPNATPTIVLQNPLNNSLVTTRNFTLDFNTINWSIQGKGSTHIIFHIDSVPGFSYNDDLSFFNDPDNSIELNNAQTGHASRIDNDTIQFNNVPDGPHAIRAELTYGDGTNPPNSESDRFIVIFMNETKCLEDWECNDGRVCTNDFCDNNNECQNTNIQLGEISCGIGVCERTINRCVNGEEQVCVRGTPGPQEICDLKDNNCDGIVDEGDTCDVSMTIHYPKNGIYHERRVPFNIEVTLTTDSISMIDYSDKNPKEKALCKKCQEFGNERPRSVSFADGFHNLTITALKGMHLDFEELFFFVDSTSPRILKGAPLKGYANGTFSLEFTESYPKNLTLWYGNEEDTRAKELDLNDCSDIRPGVKFCETFADLFDFNGNPVSYWFELADLANNSAQSKARDLTVDLSAPVITDGNVSVNGKKALFNISVSETVDISVFDRNESRPRWTTLCRNCDSYNKDKSFSAGGHDLLIRAEDPAGNFDEEYIGFVIG